MQEGGLIDPKRAHIGGAGAKAAIVKQRGGWPAVNVPLAARLSNGSALATEPRLVFRQKVEYCYGKW